jgi:hypothetical protein
MALRFWNFELRNTPSLKSLGDQKISWKKKRSQTTTPPKKGTSTAFCAGLLTPKKKVGVEQEKVSQVILDSA